MKTDSTLPDSVEKSPEQLLAPFAKGRIAQWMVVAVIIHVLLIGGTSLGYIRDHWIDPADAAERKAAAEAAQAAEKAKIKPVGKATPATPTAPSPAAVAPTNAAAPAPVISKVNTMEDRQNTPVVKRITTTATTNEIPKAPDDLDINLRDTTIK